MWILSAPHHHHPAVLAFLRWDESKISEEQRLPFAASRFFQLLAGCTFPKPKNQWGFLVPLIGGRWYIITQLAVYTTSIAPETTIEEKGCWTNNKGIKTYPCWFMLRNQAEKHPGKMKSWSQRKFHAQCKALAHVEHNVVYPKKRGFWIIL